MAKKYEILTDWQDLLRPGDEFRCSNDEDWTVTFATGVTLDEMVGKSHNMITEFRRPLPERYN